MKKSHGRRGRHAAAVATARPRSRLLHLTHPYLRITVLPVTLLVGLYPIGVGLAAIDGTIARSCTRTPASSPVKG